MTTYRGVEYMEVGGQHAPALLPRERASDIRWIGSWLGSRAMRTLWRVQAMECFSCKFSDSWLRQLVSAAKTTLLFGNCLCYRPRVTRQGTIYSATSERKSYSKYLPPPTNEFVFCTKTEQILKIPYTSNNISSRNKIAVCSKKEIAKESNSLFQAHNREWMKLPAVKALLLEYVQNVTYLKQYICIWPNAPKYVINS